MRPPVVLCTLRMDPAGEALLASAATLLIAPDPSAATLARLVGEADYLVVRTALPPDLLERPHHLRAIVRHGTGLDMIPMDAATLQGIPVANVPGANAQAVAEYVVGSFFNLARRFGDFNAALGTRGWADARQLSLNTVELSGKTVGIVGVGDIGRRIALICSAGLGMRVIGHQRQLDTLPDFVQGVPLDVLLSESDFVTINCPLAPDTRHLIDFRRIRLMKRTAFLVNAARGEVVDEAALARSLQERLIAGASLDVFATHPLSREHPFFGLENLVLTPHVAALTQESSAKMSRGTAAQILQLMNGERPSHLVNPEVWPSWPYRKAHIHQEH
jgi:D-3-phosphoglycerate dehydrogenase / 2-oxoglutarate reductase